VISMNLKPQDIKERTFSFALEIIKFAQSMDFRNEALRTLGRQLLRSGTSIGAESRETIYWLRLLKEAGMNGDWGKLIHEANEIARIIGAIVVTAKKTRITDRFLPFYF
jgi:hypothetical protein